MRAASLGCAIAGFGMLVGMASGLQAAEPGCGQALVDGAGPPATTSFIVPRSPVRPFYQWENNDGYCGEVSLMQAGLANGQWMSQFNTRLVCGTGLSQSGPNGACAAQGIPDDDAQLLIEDPGTGVTGPHTYAAAALCVANSRLAGSTFPYETQATGLAGYKQYMSWVKGQVIAGYQVTMALLINGGTDAQYDHEVAVLKIGTNHAVNDATYYPDDVLYIDDHGAYTLKGKKITYDYPAIPPGAGNDNKGCTPYVYGYSFASLPQTRAGANNPQAYAYSIIIPGNRKIQTWTGGTGYAPVTIHGPHNYAFSVGGPADPGGETLPVTMAIIGPTVTRGVTNPRDPVAGYDYENAMIGTNQFGNGCTNVPPSAWMTHVVLQATVTGLTPGVGYNLYEYVFNGITGTGSAAALAVPTADFNANAAMASHVDSFTAVGTSYVKTVTTTSNKIVVFRAVPADGP